MTCRFRGLPHADVPAAFDASAAVYDKLVAASPGYHEQLRLSVRRMRLPDEGRGLRLLDAGCGTGASTAALLAVAPHAQIVAVDASAGMLAQAAAKPWPPTVRFVLGRVEDLGTADIEGPFDAVFAAYLLRNLADPDAGLRTLRGLLRPADCWRCTNIRCATRRSPQRRGTCCAGPWSSPQDGWPAETPACTATCGAASTISTARLPFGTGCATTGSVR
ncbi:ubiE/COQ5 methyltransferase family protein [Mycobacterium xenopi 3993]|nr:ubiE/COQ5 methyltransferase family protein [Mycobacterium xenopi 3993]